MPIARAAMLLVAWMGCAAARQPIAGDGRPQAPPQVLLRIPFDGTLDIAFAANGRTRPSYLHAAYRPGVKAQGAELGSDRQPSGLVIPCQDLLDKARGSIEFWYMPLWDAGDRLQQGVTRTLVTDEKPPGVIGHFWLTIERGLLVFGWQGQQAVSVATSVHRWKPETWHHVVATWDGTSAIRLFLDGVQASELVLSWVLPPSELLYIGADRCGGQRAGGLFDELRLYDRALTPTEVELAFIHTLNAKDAPLRSKPEGAQPPVAPRRVPAAGNGRPRLSFHATFDNLTEAQTAAGDARPVVAEGTQFERGLLGQALAADTGLRLEYNAEKNLSKDQGALTVWARALPEKSAQRGVLVSDDLLAWDPNRDVPGSFALWFRRGTASRCAFGLWPVAIEETLDRWEAGDWHHLAACWQRGEQATFYVNGREVGRASGARAAWGTEALKRLCIGSLRGKSPACALFDDLRLYDAPLSREEVQKQAGRFLLPLVMTLDRTLYERGHAAEVLVRFYNIFSEELKVRLAVRVLDPEGTEVHRVEAPVEVGAQAWGRLRLPLKAEAFAAAGLYEVATSCEGRVSCPRASFLVIAGEAPSGANPAAGGGKLVDSADCAKQAARDIFCETGGSRVVKGELGAYREAGAYPDARFAYRFRVARADVPHVAVVTYPADRARSAEIIMTSRRYPASQDVAVGYLVDDSDAAEPRMLDLPIFFWPRERENALIFRTLSGGQPAACARITVREVAAAPPAPAASAPRGRTLGVHWDAPAVPLQLGAPRTKPQDVYESFRRLVDYLALNSHNVLFYPVAWHSGTLYPVEGEEFRLGAGADYHPTDWIEYVLRLCGQRGILFVPEIVFDDMVSLSMAFGADSTASVVAGAKTARMVLWDDTLSRGEPGDLPRYNPLHPAVRAALLDRVTEVVERYGRFPALGGVSVALGPGQSTWFGSIQCGYDDQTVGEFAKEAGIEVPEGRSGPTRFSERARWLLANKYDQWVNFRCRRLRQVYVDLASRVQSKRPALKLYLTVGLPDSLSGHPLLNLTAWANRPPTLDALYREAGLDTALLKDRPANLIVRLVMRPTDRANLLYRFGSGGPNPHPAAASDLAFLSEGAAPLLQFPRVAAACSHRPFESTIGLLRPMPGLWWADHPYRASHPTPAGRRFLEPYAHAVAELDVSSLTVGGNALVTLGHEEHLREFARSFCALPAEPFSSVLGLSDPVCIRELQAGANQFFYLVSRAGFPVDAYLAFSGKGVKLHDFAEGKELDLPQVEKRHLPAALPKDFESEHLLPDDEAPVPGPYGATQPVTGALLHVRLKPFELRAYRVLASGGPIEYAGCSVPEGVRVRLAQRIESAKSLVAHSAAGGDAIAAARATLDLIARAWRKHELTRVGRLLDSYPLARLR